MCATVCVVREQLADISSLLSSCESQKLNQVARLGSKYLYPASQHPRWPFYHRDDLRIAGEAVSM